MGNEQNSDKNGKEYVFIIDKNLLKLNELDPNTNTPKGMVLTKYLVENYPQYNFIYITTPKIYQTRIYAESGKWEEIQTKAKELQKLGLVICGDLDNINGPKTGIDTVVLDIVRVAQQAEISGLTYTGNLEYYERQLDTQLSIFEQRKNLPRKNYENIEEALQQEE